MGRLMGIEGGVRMRIIAVDPGKMCGVFVYDTLTNAWTTCEDIAYSAVVFIEAHISATDDTHVVAERFTFQAKLTHQYDAIETIGALRFICRRLDFIGPRRVTFTLQGRAQRMRVSYDDLRHIGWYRASPGGHVMEATRHAVIALARACPDHGLVRALAGKIQ